MWLMRPITRRVPPGGYRIPAPDQEGYVSGHLEMLLRAARPAGIDKYSYTQIEQTLYKKQRAWVDKMIARREVPGTPENDRTMAELTTEILPSPCAGLGASSRGK